MQEKLENVILIDDQVRIIMIIYSHLFNAFLSSNALKSLIEEHACLIFSDFFHPARLKISKKNPTCLFIPSCLLSKILPYFFYIYQF